MTYSLTSEVPRWPHSVHGLTCLALIAAALLLLVPAMRRLEPYLRFIWHAFIAPIGTSDQRGRLEKFYRGQANIYDKTRSGLLRGRKTMLSLSAAHLREMRSACPTQRFVWVDIGGGTGFNIEAMQDFLPIETFDAVYLVDLCEPLCAVARARFARRGWRNVHVLCQDAASFVLPEPGWTHEGGQKGSISFVTFSYSLSMIPNFYPVLDRITHILHPSNGLLSVVDFYTAGKSSHRSLHERAIGGPERECGWLSRWFWQIWFDFDHIYLGSQRRDYLEYKFGTIKSYNGRNRFVLPFIIRIPYYIWLGRPRTCDVSRFVHAFEVEGGNSIGNTSPRVLRSIRPELPYSFPGRGHLSTGKEAELADSRDLPKLDNEDTMFPIETTPRQLKLNDDFIIDVTSPLSSFHYQVKNPWRLPYYDQRVHREFRTFVYSFTWEDPIEDMKHLSLGPDDTMFVITSAGDNALHYAIEAKPKRIHCVDINPCQGHLFELKLAALQVLPFADFFALFGAGLHPGFRQLLDAQLSPLLSSIAYQFWRINAHMFEGSRRLSKTRTPRDVSSAPSDKTQPKNSPTDSQAVAEDSLPEPSPPPPVPSFYLRGYSGLALRFAQTIFRLMRVERHVRAMCNSSTLSEQQEIYKRHIRPVLLNPLIALLFRTPVFCWNALGVPNNQLRMLLEEGTVWEYVRDTFDGIPTSGLLREGAYHYLLTLLGHYMPSSCPSYLTRGGFDALRADGGVALDAFRLHTDSMISVLRGLPHSSITRAVVMDHLDWFDRDGADARAEIVELSKALTSGGFVLLRSVARAPWYMKLFTEEGFVVEALAVRMQNSGTAIDRVNMYASFWKALKP